MKIKNEKYKKFLLSNKSNFISYAISKLHVTYETHDKSSNLNIFSSIRNNYLNYKDLPNTDYKKKFDYDVAIISNITSLKNIRQDMYFGDLSDQLWKNNIKTLSIYRNHTKKTSLQIRGNFNRKNTILLSKRLNYFMEVFIFIKFIKEILFFIFTKKYSLIKNDLSIINFVTIIPNLRLIYQLDNIFKIYKPKSVIFTYEGHAWERLLMYLCKNYTNKVTTIAAQFSIIKKNQSGIFNKLKKNFNPDYIATTGDLTFKEIKKKIKHSKIFKLGSSKFKKPLTKSYKTIDLLVSLDTDHKKLLSIISFCKNFALNNRELKIILRAHPILLNDNKLMSTIKKEIHLIKNIKISTNNLIEDLKRSKYLLFTQSAISITGLSYNVTPLFFEDKDNLNIFDYRFPKKNIIKNHQDLKLILNDKKNEKISNYFKNFRDNYFEKYQIKDLKKIIRKF